MKEDGVLVLGDERALDIVEWWVGVDYASVHKLLERWSVSWEWIFYPSSAPGKSSETGVYLSEEGFSFWISQWNCGVINIKVFHVMTAIRSFINMIISSDYTEGFDREKFTLVHFSCLICLHNWNTLSSMDLVRSYRMAAQVLHTLDWKGLAIDRALVGLHHFLNVRTDFTQTRVNTSRFDTLIGCSFDSLKELIIHWVESDSKCTIDNITVYLCTKINFHYIIVLKNCLVTWVWSIMRSAMVYAATCWESDTGLETVLLN